MIGRLVLGSLWNRRGRMAVACVALLVPAALVTGASNFLLDADAKLRTEVRRRGPNLVVRPVGETMSAESTAATRTRHPRHAERLDGKTAVRFEERTTEARHVQVDPKRAADVWSWWRVDGAWLREGQCLVGRRLADRLRLQPGQVVSVGGRDLAVSGILETGDEDERAVLTRVSGAGRSSRIDFILDADAAGVEEAAERIRREVPGATAEPVRALTASEGKIASRLRRVFVLVTIFVLILSGAGMAATFAATVQEQRKEIGLTTALGAPPRLIVRMLFLQGLAVLAAALIAGAALGVGLSDFLGRRVFGLSPSVRPLAFLIALGVCGATAIAALIVPARRAAAIEPAVVLREE